MQIEIRNNEAFIKGYVNAVCRDSREIITPKGAFVEQVTQGAWNKALTENRDVMALLNHDYDRKLGSTAKGSLKLSEDNIGLYAELRVSDSEVVEKAKNNKLVGWSFGFVSKKESWGKTDSGSERRYLEEIELREVSILDDSRTPAYYGTSIEKREDNSSLMVEMRTIPDKSNVDIINNTDSKVDEDLEKQLKLLEMELFI